MKRTPKPVPLPALLERLEPSEAQHVLRRLVCARPEIASQAEDIARSLLDDVNCEQVADDVEDTVRSLGFEDLDSGPTPYGYTEPCEAAREVLEQTVKPFVEDLKRRIELGHEAEALKICTGILLGLYRLREDEEHDVLVHAPDFLEEAAGDALATWYRAQHIDGGKKLRRRPPEFPSDFIEQSIPAWKTLVDRVRRRR